MSSVKAFFAVLIGSACLSLSATTVYLKADATGDGSGSSWANAFTSLTDAVAELNASTDAQPTLKIAKGVYDNSTVKTLSVANFIIQGGYRAETDDDETRDPKEYQTIFFPGTEAKLSERKLKHKWPHVTGLTIEGSGTMAFYKDGKLQFPEDTGDYTADRDCFVQNDSHGSQTVYLTVEKASGGSFSGINFVGGFRKPQLQVAAGATGIQIEDCGFYFGYPQSTLVSIGSGVPAVVRRCAFRFNTIPYGGGILGVGANSTIDSCLVSDNEPARYYNQTLVTVSGSGSVMTNCVFRRNLVYYSDSTDCGKIAGLLAAGSDARIVDTAFTNNFHSIIGTFNISPILAKGAQFERCVLANNLMRVNPMSGLCYALVASTYQADNNTFDGCVFRGNVFEGIEAPTGDFCAAPLANGVEGSRLSVVNCTFDSNVASSVAAEGVTATLSRGVLVRADASLASSSGLGLANCTFTGPAVDGVKDVVQYGASHAKPLNVINCVFMNGSVEPVNPFRFDVPALACVRDCAIKNMRTSYLPTDVDLSQGLTTDAIPLARDGELMRPSAKTPGIHTSADVAVNVATYPQTFQYRLRDTDAWSALNPAIATSVSSSPVAVGDAAGAVRTFGSFTRGAVQTLAEPAESGATLTVRVEPLTAGTVSEPSTQATTVNGAIMAVTATPVEGTSFAGWFDVDGTTPVSTSPTLSGLQLSEDRIVVAKFSTRAVRVVYDLEGKGVFAETGTDKFTINTNAGLDFPVCTAPFTVNEGWIFVKWLATPAKVPSDVDEVVATAKIVTTDVRAVYLTPTGAGAQDGTSWANAYGNLQAAVDDAAICRGEVWAQEGVYRMSVATALRSNVAIRGGFAGTETSAAEADPVAHETIFTGDGELDDYWTTNSVKAFNIIANGKIAMPSGDGDNRDVIWRHAYVTTPTAIGFTDESAETPVTNVCFSGVTIANFSMKAVRLGSGTTAEFDTCRFVANASDDAAKADYVTLACAGQVVLRDCRFTGNHRAASLGAGSGCTNLVAGCTFEHGRSVYSTCGLSIGGSARTIVTNCVFRRNCAVGNMYYSAPASAIGVGQNALADLLVCDTVFSKNRAEGTAIATVMIRNGSNAVAFERCRFLENSYSATTTLSSGYYMERLPGSAGISSLSSSTLTIRSTTFETNVTSVVIPQNTGTAVTNNYASAVGFGWGGSVRLLNCAFLGNRLTDGSDVSLPYESGTVSSGYSSSGTALAVVNCLFRDNVVSSLNRAPAEIALVGAAKETVTFLNDVLWGSDASYRPFAFATPVTPQLSACVIRNFDATAFAEADQHSYCRKVSVAEPSFSPTCRLRLGGTSVGTRGGVRVHATESGAWYFKDTTTQPDKPWRKVLDRGSFSASVEGLSEDPLPDMEGVSRLRRVSYGPLNADYPGLLLIVR